MAISSRRRLRRARSNCPTWMAVPVQGRQILSLKNWKKLTLSQVQSSQRQPRVVPSRRGRIVVIKLQISWHSPVCSADSCKDWPSSSRYSWETMDYLADDVRTAVFFSFFTACRSFFSCHVPACRYLPVFWTWTFICIGHLPCCTFSGGAWFFLEPSLLPASDNVPASSTLLNMSQMMNSSSLMTQMLSPKK